MVAKLPEVLGTKAEQCGAVELRVPPDVVVHLRRELLAVPVEPELRRPVPPLDEHRGRAPVVALPGQVVAALQQQDLPPGPGQPVGERSTSRTRADDDDVEMRTVDHQVSLRACVLYGGVSRVRESEPVQLTGTSLPAGRRAR